MFNACSGKCMFKKRLFYIRYLPYVKRAFMNVRYTCVTRFTRLPCVERMFNMRLKKRMFYVFCTFSCVLDNRKSPNLFSEMSRAKEKYRGVFEIQKSGDKTSSGEIGLDIRTHASPKVGQDQVSGGVSVLCWHAAPVAYVPWKPCTIEKKVKFGNKVQISNGQKLV